MTTYPIFGLALKTKLHYWKKMTDLKTKPLKVTLSQWTYGLTSPSPYLQLKSLLVHWKFGDHHLLLDHQTPHFHLKGLLGSSCGSSNSFGSSKTKLPFEDFFIRCNSQKTKHKKQHEFRINLLEKYVLEVIHAENFLEKYTLPLCKSLLLAAFQGYYSNAANSHSIQPFGNINYRSFVPNLANCPSGGLLLQTVVLDIFDVNCYYIRIMLLQASRLHITCREGSFFANRY